MKLLCINGDNCAYITKGKQYIGAKIPCSKYKSGLGYKIKGIGYVYDLRHFTQFTLSKNIKIL